MNQVRHADPRDIPAIMKLLVQVDMVHHNGRPDLFKGPATKYTEDQLLSILADEKTPVFVCVDEEDRVLGHAFCVLKQELDSNILTDIRTLYIDDICVDEVFRGQKVGRALYDHAVAFAREQNCYNVTLNVWTLNQNAMAFYERLGMTPQKIGMELLL